MFASRSAIFFSIHPDATLDPTGERIVATVAEKRVPFNEKRGMCFTRVIVVTGDLTSGCTCDEFFDDLLVGHSSDVGYELILI